MDELKELLKNVSGTYDDFVRGVLNFCLYRDDRKERIMDFIM